MESRNGSSSPDPLGYPGDPEFLLSSATKPFSHRRLSMTPFKSRTPRTPWSTRSKGKRSAKSVARSIKYPDIVLPSTPSGDRFNQRSLSPTKTTMHSESNISPWRIRVTVEAERDEEEEGQNIIQSRAGGWKSGNALKIPLKGGNSSAEPSPKKSPRKGKKTDVSKRAPTPGKKRPAGIFDGVLDSVGKRKRGRSRKTLEPVGENSPTRHSSPAKSIADLLSGDDPFLDIAQGGVDGAAYEPETHASTYQTTQPNLGAPTIQDDQTSPKLTPIAKAGERLQSGQPGKEFGVSETSPIHGDVGPSPINVTFAGHTPRPKFRLYPTPTSSSQLGEEPLDANNIHSSTTKTKVVKLGERIADPNEDHREFDSIMESEGFSMVSLNSLPSAKRKLLSSLEGRSSIPVTIETPLEKSLAKADAGTEIALENGASTPSAAEPSPATDPRPTETALGGWPANRAETDDFQAQKPVLNDVPPHHLTPPAVPVVPEQVSRRSLIVRLARIIRTGISLQRMLNRNWRILNSDAPLYNATDTQDDDSEATRRRIEKLFEGFSMEIRRDLCAALRFGKALAQRTRIARQEWQPEVASDEHVSVSDSGGIQYPLLDIAADGQSLSTMSRDENHDHSSVHLGTPTPRDENLTEKINMEMAKREEQWQREREAISRQIEAASESQVIVIESDDERLATQSPLHQDQDIPGDLRNQTTAEDDDYEDIWQQEAREGAIPSDSPSFAEVTHDDTVHPRRTAVPTNIGYAQDEENFPRQPWSAHTQKYPMLSLGKSQLEKYRDMTFEFSSLIRTPESSTRRWMRGALESASTRGSNSMPNEAPLQQAPTSAVAEANTIEDVRQQARPPFSSSSDSISELPPPPSLKYTGSDIMTNGQHEPSPLLGDQMSPNLRYVGDNAENQFESNGEARNDLEEDVHTVSPNFKAQETAINPSWFNRLTNIAPKWFVASPSTQSHSIQNQPPLDQPEYPMQSTSFPPVVQEQADFSTTPRATHRRRRPNGKPLALSGYFTNDHYFALRRIYRKAKESPHLFHYAPTPERDAMLGKWMWSADGHHHRQVTEIQLAVVDKFRKDLIEASRKSGGPDTLGWTEEDILWRLFSIIVGEKIRRERKRQQAVEDTGDGIGDAEIPGAIVT
ncbi:hypothetical protein D8B26_003029 [Coccidioides posadasii str. Silveira]|uniref:Uncharacterized protein n=1 Tax=Coccidioides posadasii (strain RMSCC 757 / Silveira) TaxID=443226 RepID=E9CZI2_COCPS|nr:conserved hypothetical protein [Coccidioides posadasii str. Silveira]QVM08338.1 hypothetical protein D8B26_003029 [Coccidioides posadasii str. Silveira]